MAKIVDKIAKHKKENSQAFFSYEFFPPKTEMGVQNLYERLDRMSQSSPLWIDVTWGAGGSTAEKTLEICRNAQKYHGVDVMMHLTCTNMHQGAVDEALIMCKESGIRNILALRGDPPADQNSWTQTAGGFAHAIDLVKHIKSTHNDYFCVGVAGYPEGHVDSESFEDDLFFLKEKVDAGADLVITQLFYDVDCFVDFVSQAKAIGIQVPIIPGIMPIQSYSGFKRMTEFCKTKIPEGLLSELEPIKDNDSKVKEYGVNHAVGMCRKLMKYTFGLHFYTLNLETSVIKILAELHLIDENSNKGDLPWRATRADESVRPIFWSNRTKSYIERTEQWDEYPNGRFGNLASPAYGDFNFVSFGKESWEKIKVDRLKMWGQTCSCIEDVRNVFVSFLKGDVKRLPWCYESPTEETQFIKKQLLTLNKSSCLTINSQPRVNAALSTDPYHGWGPEGGYVYQKAYVEFFCSPVHLMALTEGIANEKLSTLSYIAVNKSGTAESCVTNLKPDSVNAVTWGVFPGREIIQPTVVCFQSLMAWKDEAFALWDEWIDIYRNSSPSSVAFLEKVRDTYLLVTVVDDDFVGGDLFTGLMRVLPNLQKPPSDDNLTTASGSLLAAPSAQPSWEQHQAVCSDHCVSLSLLAAPQCTAFLAE